MCMQVRTLLHAWDEMYWLAKTNRICAGSVSAAESEHSMHASHPYVSPMYLPGAGSVSAAERERGRLLLEMA